MAVNQKGANGIVAEYRAAAHLNQLLAAAGFGVAKSQGALDHNTDDALARVANELTDDQRSRALRQGEHLAAYIFNALSSDPDLLGLELRHELSRYQIDVDTLGHLTNKGDPTDLRLSLHSDSDSQVLDISLKANRGDVSSLGSKAGRASLGRLFLNKERISKAEFLTGFGAAAEKYEAQIARFKSTAKEFYTSPASKAFIDAYEARKGTRKVNNPLRRKEVGDYFLQKHGFMSEHILAQHFVEAFNFAKSSHRAIYGGYEFVGGLKFLLGNPQMLVLDVKDGSDQVSVINSLTDPHYKKLNSILRPGLDVMLTSTAGTSTIGVQLHRDGETFDRLSLAMWKDGTIQFKIDTADRK